MEIKSLIVHYNLDALITKERAKESSIGISIDELTELIKNRLKVINHMCTLLAESMYNCRLEYVRAIIRLDMRYGGFVIMNPYIGYVFLDVLTKTSYAQKCVENIITAFSSSDEFCNFMALILIKSPFTKTSDILSIFSR